MSQKTTPDPAKAADDHNSYQEYNKSLRTWLVAFGIGGPVMLLTREAMLTKLATEGVLKSVSLYFLIGVATQVLIAFINKVECWYCYYAHVDTSYAKTRRGQFMLWLDDQFWIDVFCDVVSIVLFALAIVTVFRAYV
jgi:hypothetical protein